VPAEAICFRVVRPSVRPCIRDSRGSFMFPRYLQYLLTDFRQTFVTGASWDTDDLITFLGQKVRVQGHTIAAEVHSTRRYRRVQLFLVVKTVAVILKCCSCCRVLTDDARMLAANSRGNMLTMDMPEWKRNILGGSKASFGKKEKKSILEQRQSLPIYKLKDELVKVVYWAKSAEAFLSLVVDVRDVPDIQFRFWMVGYPVVFYYPVPVPAQLFPETGYLNRIIVVHRCGQ